MEKYVVSLELAEQLKAAGYLQQTVWGWAVPDSDEYQPKVYELGQSFNVREWFAAPLSDELLEQLPVHTELRKPLNGLGGGYEAKYVQVMTRSYDNGKEYWEMKPVDALAQLWLWCKENGYIK